MKMDEREVEIDLLQLLKTLWEKAAYILVVTVVFGIIGFFASSMLLTPIYEASAKMIVNTRKDDNQNVTNDQLNSAKNLVNTYAIIIRSRDVLNRVISDLDLDMTYGSLASNVRVSAVNNTQVMQITVQDENPDTALAIAKKILDIAPAILVEKVEAGSVKAVEQAYSSKNPVSPNNYKNGALVALIAFVFSCGIVAIRFLTDNTYKTDMDIHRDLDLPVLGVIPTVESCTTRARYGKKAKGGK